MIGGHWDVLSDNENDEVYNLGTGERYVIVNGMKYIIWAAHYENYVYYLLHFEDKVAK